MKNQTKPVRVGIMSSGTFSAWYWFAGTVIILPGDFATELECVQYHVAMGYRIVVD